LAVWFLWQHYRQVPLQLVGLAGLFVAQMFVAARLPWNLFRQHLWQQLIARFGHGEIELCRERLFSGNRVGILWSGQNRDVGEIHGVVVYVYQDTSVPLAEREATDSGMLKNGDRPPGTLGVPDDFTAGRAAVPFFAHADPLVGAHHPPAPAERAVLAIETSTKIRWLLVDGFSRSETLTLAEDLHRRIAAFIKRYSSQSPLPRPVVIETHERVLYPPLAPDFYRRRKPRWLGIHLAGAVGLAGLTAIAIQTGAWQISSTKVTILLGWLLEILLVVTTVSLPDTSETASTSA
jgi:hypothetical protein